MITVKPNEECVFEVPFESKAGLSVEPSEAEYGVVDADGAYVVPIQPVDLTDNSGFAVITIPASANADPDSYRLLQVKFVDEKGITYIQETSYIVGNPTELSLGVNSFASYGNLMVAAHKRPGLNALSGASTDEVKHALMEAWYNIGLVNVDLSNIGLSQGVVYLDQNNRPISRLSALSENQLLSLPKEVVTRLVRAQLTEADSILGGNPVEDRRKAGMVSSSAGESTLFFRTRKPVDMPISRDTAKELTGIISWVMNLGR